MADLQQWCPHNRVLYACDPCLEARERETRRQERERIIRLIEGERGSLTTAKKLLLVKKIRKL